MTSKPPPIPPPPMRNRNRESDVSNRLYWMIAPAVLLGVLFAIFFLSWLVNRSDLGKGKDSFNNGAQNSVADLDHDNGSETGIAVNENTESESIAVADPNNNMPVPPLRTEPKDGSEEEPANNPETVLLIVEQRPTSKASQSGARGANLAAGGVNPFVGTGSSAKTTVYVIDVSGSMQTQDRLPRVISTLKRAVDLLTPDQMFTVILFDDGFHTDPIGKGLLQANRQNKQAIYDWLDNAPGGSGTNPLPAMIIAIQQKPERIVLLSDGEFDPTSAFAITNANRSNVKPARIDCVGLMEEVETLKEISRSNNGIYYQAQ